MRLATLSIRPWQPNARLGWRCTLKQAGLVSYSRRRAYTARPELDLQTVDQKWQKRWQKRAAAPASGRKPDKPKSYVLAMFPYPSGALHMGHLRNYAVADVLARFQHMQGHDVLHPMGWDAFGLPAENAAIERGVHPAQWTKENTARMKEQLLAMNGGMDWSREFMTSDPDFYKHTQRLFLLLHHHGLAYQAEALVNYDPIDQTVLANEQVDADGLSWRSGAKVEQVNLRQWFLKITSFRERLLQDLEFLGHGERWPERVLAMQRHWLGRSEGANVKFPYVNTREPTGAGVRAPIEVFTTRPDTLFGAQYLALSPSHPLVRLASRRHKGLTAFLDTVFSLPPDSKAGFQIPDVYARNPICLHPSANEDLADHLPVFVAPYVLDGYGSGAVMGVPGHDPRDFAFWSQNRPGQAVRQVVEPNKVTTVKENGSVNEAFTALGHLSSFCTPFHGQSSKEASENITSWLAEQDLGAKAETWRLRDWLISRQRYWGTPIPIIHCDSCGAVPVPEEQLPVELPAADGAWFKSRTGNPLEAAESWINVPCPKCNSPAKRDTDTMDTFMDSSWYFFRFTDPHNASLLFDPKKVDENMPVDIYIGGIEHAILHLLYARFISKFLTSIGLWPAGNQPGIRGEPFQRLLSQGMVHGKTYSDPETGRFLKPEELDLSNPNEPRIGRTGEKPTISFEKMSKSKHNGVDPSSFIAKYGADVTRAHILFQAPVTDVLEWEEDRIVGIQRWFQRIWRLVDRVASRETDADSHTTTEQASDLATYNPVERSLHNALHRTTASVTTSLSETYTLNTCISDLMQLTNHILDGFDNTEFNTKEPIRPGLLHEATGTLIRLLAPFAPAFASECWERLNLASTYTSEATSLRYSDVFEQPFPTTSSTTYLAPPTQTCVVMENGRKRFETALPAPPDGLAGSELQAWVLEELRQSDKGRAWFERKGEAWDRVVIVKDGKTVNFVGKAGNKEYER